MINVRIRSGCAVLLSLLFLTTIAVRYWDKPDDCVEMTFLSNAATGAALLLSGVYSFVTRRDMPVRVCAAFATLMAVVALMCGLFAPSVCFVGSSVILHLVTPVCIILYFLLFCDARGMRLRDVWAALLFPTAYYIFMITYGRISGSSVYIYFDTNAMPGGALFLAGIVAEAVVAAVFAALVVANKILHARVAGIRWKRKHNY